MSEELEQSGSDVSAEGSSPSTESTDSNTEKAASKEAASESKQEQYVPYERFKELVEQKNQFSRQFEDQQKLIKDLQSKFEASSKPKTASPEEKLLERLKGIDPEFASWAEKQEAARRELEQLKSWRDQSEQTQNRAQVQNTLSQLQTEHKVDKFWHDNYIARLKDLARVNTQLGPQDLPRLYKTLHDERVKYEDTNKRAILAEYTSAKKTDSKVPPPAKGQAPKTSQSKQQAPVKKSDPEIARKSLAKEMLSALRASKESAN